jgi:undecaprenyl diphosphate synthase
MKIPRHLAIIMDGNGRWAESQGLPRVRGHEAGADSVREIVRASREIGVEVLTLYSFSTENWRRPQDEVTALMGLLKRYVLKERREILDNGIRLRAIGQIKRLPMFVRLPLNALIHESRNNKRMVLNLALSYGARAEMVSAMQDIARRVAGGSLSPDQINEELVSSALSTAGLPDPDLVIRTSGEYRLSNFLLWQVAYAELYVTDVPWPDFRRPNLEEAFRSFGSRERRFGKTGSQLQTGRSGA